MKNEKVQFVKVKPTSRPLVSIQRSGFPVFLKEASGLMGLTDEHYFKVAKGKHNCIFLFPTNDPAGNLRVVRFGLLFYTRQKELFRQLGAVRNQKYLITAERYLGQIIYKIHL